MSMFQSEDSMGPSPHSPLLQPSPSSSWWSLVVCFALLTGGATGCRDTEFVSASAPIAEVPNRVVFPATPVGSVSSAVLVLKNSGAQTLVIQRLEFAPEGAVFALRGSDQAVAEVGAGAEIEVEVLFAPTLAGEANGELTI